MIAQCCSGGVPMSSNIGMPVSEKGTLQLNFSYDWNNLETLKSSSDVLDDDSRQRETHSLYLQMGYSFTDRLSLDVFIPSVRQERTIISPLGNKNFVFSQGIGDMVILPKFSITSQLTIGFGVKIPTGQSDKSSEGITYSADLQPGSGSVDQIFYLAYANTLKSRPTMGYSSNLIITKRGINKEYLGNSSYQFGDEFQIILGLADRFLVGSAQFDPSLQFRYRKAGRDFFNDAPFPGSGGEFVFITPGISYLISPKLTWNFKASFPLHAFVNDTQLSPTTRLTTGLLLKINLKSTQLFDQ